MLPMKAVWMSTVCAAMEVYGWVVCAVAEGRVDVWQYTVCTAARDHADLCGSANAKDRVGVCSRC